MAAAATAATAGLAPTTTVAVKAVQQLSRAFWTSLMHRQQCFVHENVHIRWR